MKKDRHSEILRIIRENEIGTQEELAQKLRESGFEVTQATVSRDIRALKLTKVADESGRIRYALMQPEREPEKANRFERVLRETFISMEQAENILVIKTSAGMAMAAAAALDGLAFDGIAGSIAGDDTIFCAVRSREEAARIMEKLRALLRTE